MSQLLDTLDTKDAKITEDDRLRQIARHIPGVIYQFQMRPDSSLHFLYASDGLQEVHGVSPAEAYEDISKVFEVVHPEDVDRLTQSILISSANMTPWYCEYRVNLPNGRQLWLLGNSTPQREVDGSTLWHGYIRDITESKTTELALQASENKFRGIIENLNDMVYVIKADASFSYVSPQFQEVMGYPLAELLNDSFAKLVHPEDLSICVDALQRSFQGEKIRGVEYRALHQDGNYYWHSSNVSALQNDKGEVVACLGISSNIHDRKATEAALAESEAQNRAILQSIPDIMFRVNESGVYLSYSTSTTLFDCGSQETIGKFMGDYLSPEHYQRHKHHMDIALETRQVQIYEQEIEVAGHIQQEEVRVVPIENKQDLLFMIRDISDRKAAQAALKVSETNLRTIFDNSNNAIFIHDIDTTLLDVNNRVLEMYGMESREAALALSVIDYSAPDAPLDQVPHFWERALAGETVRFEWKCQRPQDGSYFDSEITINKIILGSKEAMLSSVQDISDRKKVEAQLKEVSERLSLALKSGRIGCWEWNIVQNVLVWDDRMYEMYGVSAESHRDLAYDVWANGLHPDDRDQSEELIQQAILGQAEFNPEFRVVHPDGSVHFIKAFGLVQRDTEGHPQKMIGVNLDISDRKQSEILLQQQTTELEAALKRLQNTQMQLIQAEKMSSLGQLVGGIAHEINNPVSFIYGNIQPATNYVKELVELVHLYQEQYPEPPQVIAEYLEAINLEYLVHDFSNLLVSMKNGATRIRDIIKSLRTFSRLDEEGCKTIDIHENIDSTLVVLQSRFNGRDGKPEIQLIKDYGDLPLIECYGGLLNQVFVNLLVNAIDAIEQQRNILVSTPDSAYHGVITITTALNATNQVTISIQDNGCGMDVQTQEKIFNPFFTTKPIGQGTGMGLAISYQIITENHQGNIAVNSTSNQGTEFVITMPIKQANFC